MSRKKKHQGIRTYRPKFIDYSRVGLRKDQKQLDDVVEDGKEI